jgi:hypothetical protein
MVALLQNDGVVGFACPCQLQKQDDKVHGCEELKYGALVEARQLSFVAAALAHVRLLCMYSACKSRGGILFVLWRFVAYHGSYVMSGPLWLQGYVCSLLG